MYGPPNKNPKGYGNKIAASYLSPTHLIPTPTHFIPLPSHITFITIINIF